MSGEARGSCNKGPKRVSASVKLCFGLENRTNLCGRYSGGYQRGVSDLRLIKRLKLLVGAVLLAMTLVLSGCVGDVVEEQQDVKEAKQQVEEEQKDVKEAQQQVVEEQKDVKEAQQEQDKKDKDKAKDNKPKDKPDGGLPDKEKPGGGLPDKDRP
jgi:outer membrane murein-binding lipoprotein Lpp